MVAPDPVGASRRHAPSASVHPVADMTSTTYFQLPLLDTSLAASMDNGLSDRASMLD
jgi:hypothetical protein